MGNDAEPALDWLIHVAKDKQNQDPKDKQRINALVCLTDMTWAQERLQPVCKLVVLDQGNDESVRRIALSGLGKIGTPAQAVIEQVAKIGSGRLKETAHRLLAAMSEQSGQMDKKEYYAQVIEEVSD